MNTKNTIIALGILVLGAMVFPAVASAQYPNDPACPFPTVYSNGYYTCNYEPNPPPTYVPPPVYIPPYIPPVTVYPTINASCYANNTSVQAGASVFWYVTVTGGSGSYSYSWSGTDGLSGAGQSIYMNYYSPGTKTASVSIYSAGQSITIGCSNSVTVYSNYNYYPTYQPVNYPYYAPLAVACRSNTTYSSVGTPVTWTAQATGGNGYYQYTWTGTDAIYGQGQTIAYTYNTPGTKYASVTVYSNGQTLTQSCSNIVNVNVGYVNPYPTYTETPVVQSKPVAKPKVIVKEVQVPAPVTKAETPVKETANNLSAASLFSLSNIPWGWVAVLVILVLLGTVLYLLFNKTKM